MSNEAKTTKAYKIAPELKEKLERLASESGLETQEAFIEHLAVVYEMQRMKEGGSGAGYKKQLDELEYHMRRPYELFIGLVETESAARLQQSQQHEEAISARAETIFGQEQEIAEMRKSIRLLEDTLALRTKENENQAKQLDQQTEITRKDSLLVEEYRQKIDTLSGLVNEYKAADVENKELHKEITSLIATNDKEKLRSGKLEVDLAALKSQSDEQIRQLEKQHQDATERIQERKDVEKERELLSLRTEYQAKLEKANEETTSKIRELYEQIERLRTVHEQQLQANKATNNKPKT
jgi:colicin import membrane protein